jgi:hypothetical protein
VDDERAVRKFGVRSFVEPALSGAHGQPFEVKLIVNCVRSVLVRVKLQPDLGQTVVIGPATFRAGAMAGRQRRRLVQEEKLRVATRCHERCPTSSPKLQAAGDPSLRAVAPANHSGVIVKAATIAVDEPPLAGRDQGAQWCDAVLTWHIPRVTRYKGAPASVVYATAIA